MRKKASPKRTRAKQKRLSPDDRRKEFVAKATEFFSEEGFGGGTRNLLHRLGVTRLGAYERVHRSIVEYNIAR
jgi:hypothetical protein